MAFARDGDLVIATVAHWYHGVTVADLESVWPWGRVKTWHEHTTELEVRAHLPAAQSLAAFINAHRGKGSRAVTPLDVMWDGHKPTHLRGANVNTDRVTMRWSKEAVASFELALKLGIGGTALMSALGLSNLRASGWKG